jgi:hypothetical protein
MKAMVSIYRFTCVFSVAKAELDTVAAGSDGGASAKWAFAHDSMLFQMALWLGWFLWDLNPSSSLAVK